MLAAGMSGIFKYNSIYGPAVLNDSMLGASLRSTSVGGYLESRRPFLTRHDILAPSDEWFRNLIGTAGSGALSGSFASASDGRRD